TATDTVTGSITGTQSSISVSRLAASLLAIVPSPNAVTAGNSLGLTVTAQDPFGNTIASYSGTIHFTSSDIQASLPADYTFGAGDNGVHTFSSAAILRTA